MRRAAAFSLFLLLVAMTYGSTSGTFASGLANAALGLRAAVSEEHRKKLQFEFEDAERKDWSNLPDGMYPRKGLSLGQMNDGGRSAAHQLLRASLSSQGYLKAAAIIRRDDYLLRTAGPAIGGRPITEFFGAGHYYLGLFGDPGPEARWGWQFDGHHLALNFTVVKGVVTGTPALWGAEPDQIPTGDEAGWRVFGAEREKGFAVMNSLNEKQKAKALLSATLPAGIFTGPKRDKALQRIEGLSTVLMTAAQKKLLWELIDEYLNNQAVPIAEAHRQKILKDRFENVHFAWMGSIEANQPVYFRVHGPSILIEYDNAGRGRDQRDPNHIHSIYRDPSNDYGEDLLKRHYQSSPHGAEK
ncbi:MAG: DUF3500 domain-containing protein [Acidobacteria bacterium]|nr:DUF3500 domain-containing protein [Acidobacteriota bacterium]